MKVLPVINANYDNRINFKSGVVKSASNVLTSPEVANTAKAVGGAVLVYLNVVNTKKSTENKSDNYQIRELSDTEYEQMKSKIMQAKEEAYAEWKNLKGDYEKNDISCAERNCPTFAFIDSGNIDQWNVQLFDYMLKHPETYKYNYTKLADNIEEISVGDNNQKSAEVVLKMLKMPFLFPQEHNGTGHLGLNYYLSEGSDIRIKILDMIEANKTDYNETQIFNLRDILTWINTKDGLRVAKKLIEKPEILKSSISENAFRYYSNSKKYADIKVALIDKINSKPELLSDENFMKCVPAFINNVVDKHTLDFSCKILDNPILFKSDSFRKWLNGMIYEYPKCNDDTDKKTREVMYRIIDAVVKRPELFENKKFNDEFGELLFVRRGPQGEIWLNERTIEIGKRNLFLIENGYYN